jgi:hypothetical protein
MTLAYDPNVVSHWRLDEGSGTTAYDSLGDHNGTIYGATWTPDGQFGNALSFDGSDYVDIGSLGVTGDWTVCFWAKSSDNTGSVYYPIGLGNPLKGIVMGGTNAVVTQHICLYDGSNILKSLTVVEAGTWYHIAVTKHAATYSIYVDGICEKTGGLGDIDLTNFKIGVRPDSFGYFKGAIDDVGVWDKALVAGDIYDPEPGTINYVRLNGVSGAADGTAYNPNPFNMQRDVVLNAGLSWRAGEYAADVNGHRLYFSTSFNDVNNGTMDYVVLTEPNYTPGVLSYGTAYYWRVDEVNDPCVWQGRVWKFITGFGIIDANLVSNWRFDKGGGEVAYDSVGRHDGVIYGATWTSDGQFGNAMSFDGSDYIDIGNLGVTGDWTVCFWAKSSYNAGSAYYPMGLGNPRKGIAMGGTALAQRIGLYDGSNVLASLTAIQAGNWYHIAVTKHAAAYSIYVDGVREKTGGLGDIDLTNFKIGMRPDSFGYFRGIVDDVGVWNSALEAGSIEDPNPGTINYVKTNGVSGPGYGTAWNPVPIDRQTGVACNVTLEWRPVACAVEVDEHRVYFSTDFNSVHGGTVDYVSVNEPNYTPGFLGINTTYYWRVDEIIDTNVWEGHVWRFTTRPGKATNPNPASNAQQVSPNTELTWIPGGHSADTNGHDVYFGTNRADIESGRTSLVSDMDGDEHVNFTELQVLCEQWLEYVEGLEPNADINGDETVDFIDFAIMADEWLASTTAYKGRQTADWYDPCNLEYGVTYFWRIDEFNGPNVWPGEVWNFTVGIDEPALTNAPMYQITPTYDWSGQAMHPGIVYFPEGWNGYKYWMAMTPLTYSDHFKENPSILVSNDGFSWEVPPGLINPLVYPPPYGGYNADPDLVYNDDTDELWLYFLRYYANTNQTKMCLKKSADGVNWTESEYLITWNNQDSDNERSWAIIKQDSDWHYWAECRDAPYAVYYRYSTDGRNWSEPQIVEFSPEPLSLPWHLDVIYVPSKSEYWMLYSSPGAPGGSLYFAKSKDRLRWTTGLNKVLSPSVDGWDNNMLYRPTLLYDSNSQLLRVWYSAKSNLGEWHTGYTETEY